jgi:hypothetical protein
VLAKTGWLTAQARHPVCTAEARFFCFHKKLFKNNNLRVNYRFCCIHIDARHGVLPSPSAM